jgi:hypothetical protein
MTRLPEVGLFLVNLTNHAESAEVPAPGSWRVVGDSYKGSALAR